MHQILIQREDQLGELIAYTKALESEAVKMGQILSNPLDTGYWLQYQEFNLNELPQVQAFRSQYPQATFEQYLQYLQAMTQQGQQQPQPQQTQSVAPIYSSQNNVPYTQMPMGVAPNGYSPNQGEIRNPFDLLRKIDTTPLAQLLNG